MTQRFSLYQDLSVRKLTMKRALMSAPDAAWCYRPKKGKYRRRTDVPISKPAKGKYRR